MQTIRFEGHNCVKEVAVISEKQVKTFQNYFDVDTVPTEQRRQANKKVRIKDEIKRPPKKKQKKNNDAFVPAHALVYHGRALSNPYKEET